MIIIDGMLLARRTHSRMDFLTNSKGVKTGMEYGFLKTLQSVSSKLDDNGIVIAWEGGCSRRKRLCSSYKANREGITEIGFWSRLEALQGACAAIYPSYKSVGYEADDVLAFFANSYRSTERVYLYSNDKDLLQAVEENAVLITSHKSQLWMWEEEDVIKAYGVSKERFAWLKAIVGDKGDNIIGVPRLRKRILVGLVNQAESFKELLQLISTSTEWSVGELQRIAEVGVSHLANNYFLAKLHTNIPLEKIKELSTTEVREWFRELEIRSLDFGKYTDGLENELISEEEF